MPQYYKTNTYVTQAIELFKPAYNMIKTQPNDEQYIDFIIENSDEVDISNDDIETTCECNMCRLINSWDINSSLLYSTNPFKNIVLKRLSWIINM